MISHFSYVTCDRCGSPGPEADNAKEARLLARRQAGFRTRGGKNAYDLCSLCADGVMYDESGFASPVQRPKALASWIEGGHQICTEVPVIEGA